MQYSALHLVNLLSFIPHTLKLNNRFIYAYAGESPGLTDSASNMFSVTVCKCINILFVVVW